MRLEEIQKANEEADKQRAAQQEAEEFVAEPIGEGLEQPEMSEEQKTEADYVSKRKQQMIEVVREAVEFVVCCDKEFTIDELGWASDAFKNILTIRTTATEEHEVFSKIVTKAQQDFYALKGKDLTPIQYDVLAKSDEEVAE